ncbi:MAG: hypothetical protein PHX51_08660 [Clostridia bacterium]|nr:hypothetical protein [Clostridia bacterium]
MYNIVMMFEKNEIGVEGVHKRFEPLQMIDIEHNIDETSANRFVATFIGADSDIEIGFKTLEEAEYFVCDFLSIYANSKTNNHTGS